MITNAIEYEKAQEEIRILEDRLNQLVQNSSPGEKGFTKAGIRKVIANIHDELALYEGEQATSPLISK